MSLDIRRTWVQAHFHHRRKFSWMVSAALEIWEDAAERIPVCVCRIQLDPRTHHKNSSSNSYRVFEHFLCVLLCFKHFVSFRSL